MADIIKSIVTRIDTTANWTTLNPIPANGEQCIEILGRGLFKLKIGDGVTPWIALQYETLGAGFSQYKILLEKEIQERIAADNELRAALEAEVERAKEKEAELDETIGRIPDLIAELNDKKLDKVDTPSIVYGTDENGNQTTISVEGFGAIDDVQLNGTTVVVDRIANIEPVADDVAYTNEQYPAMQTLQDAMDQLLYIKPNVSISGGGVYEVGYTKESTTLNWSWNKQISNQSLNNGIGALQPYVRTYTYTTPITSDTTFTITGTDGTNSKSASTSVTFGKYYYYGTSYKDALTDEDIRGLKSSTSGNRAWASNNQTLSEKEFNCTPTAGHPDGFYAYFVLPTQCAKSEYTVKVNGLPNTGYLKTTKADYKNEYGVTIPMTIFRFMKENKLTTKYKIEVA